LFAQTESGSVSHAFIRQAADRKHASYHGTGPVDVSITFFAGSVPGHRARASAHRKKHELEYVKPRLVTLDFVLGHAEHRYLETEAEKVMFFEKDWNVSIETLPVKQYRAEGRPKLRDVISWTGFDVVDRLSSPPVVTFTYADAGACGP